MLRASVEPSVLRWARESRGLSVDTAAQRIGVTSERLSAWEEPASEVHPTVNQLRNAARAYQRPLGVFFLPEPPAEDETVKDFRRISEPPYSAEQSPALRLELRLARERRQDAIELAELVGYAPPRLGLRASLASPPDRVASRLRAMLRVSAEVQQRWRDPRLAFNSWRDRIEALGVLVFQTGGDRTHAVATSEARGFSISEHPFPTIVANGSDAPSARCFTLLHELTHIMLRTGGLCDFHDVNSSNVVDRTEVYCNYVAGAALVPADELRALVRDRAPSAAWGADELEVLALTFSVSPEVILRRLLILGQTTQAFYERWREARDQNRQAAGAGKKKGFLTPADKVIKRNGKLLPRLALQALDARRVTLASTSDILKAGPTHLERVRETSFS